MINPSEDVTNRTYLQTAQMRTNQWRDELNRLEEEIKQFPSETQAVYRRNLANLQTQWQQVEAKFKELERASSGQQEIIRSEWQITAEEYQNNFRETAKQIMDKENVPLGWLEGFTDKRPHDSAGWAEGMGKQEKGSKGWAEGYDRK